MTQGRPCGDKSLSYRCQRNVVFLPCGGVTEGQTMKQLFALCLCLSALSPAFAGENGFFRFLMPRRAAQYDYEQAVEAYKRCIATKPASACEGQRHIMDAAATALAGAGPSFGERLKRAGRALQQAAPPPPAPPRQTHCTFIANQMDCTQW